MNTLEQLISIISKEYEGKWRGRVMGYCIYMFAKILFFMIIYRVVSKEDVISFFGDE